MERRVFLAIALSLAVLLLWQWIMPMIAPEYFPPPADQTEAAPDAGQAADAGLPEARPAEPERAEAAPDAEGRPERAPETRVTLENDVVRATFTTRGGALVSWQLLGDRFAEEDEGEGRQVELADRAPDQPPMFATRFEGLDWPADADYQVVSQDGQSVVFRAVAGGVAVEKRFGLAEDRYLLAFDLSVQDAGGGARQVTPSVIVPRRIPQEDDGGGFIAKMGQLPDETRASCAFEDEVERRSYDEDEPTFGRTGGVHWAGIDSRYFLTVVFPGQPRFAQEGGDQGPLAGAACTLETTRPTAYQAIYTLPAQDVPAGGEAAQRLTGYLGPKFKTRLTAYGHQLDASIDFGFFTILSLGLLWVMAFFYELVANWGVAIILLTVTVKLVLLPLTNWSMRSMEKMRTMQPKLAALKERYGKDQQRLQQEMMKLYREEGVSPFGGCLPMLIQLPIWFALYRTILGTAELYHATFIPGWLTDLSSPEPGVIKILPLAMGVSMFLMQKMQPTAATGDETQQKMQKYMLYFMPPFFTFIMYGLPSGLTLYIFVNNVLSIAQQAWIRRRQAQLATATR